MTQAFIALGSNLEPREDYLVQAIDLLANQNEINLIKQSSIYETEPVGYLDQNQFLNMVVEVDTSLTPFELLSQCQTIEQTLGRKRLIRFGPRTVDLDILVYNHKSVRTDKLTIPHPRMFERAFVLIPLGELNHELIVDGYNVQHYINKLSDQQRKGVTKWFKKNGE